MNTDPKTRLVSGTQVDHSMAPGTSNTKEEHVTSQNPPWAEWHMSKTLTHERPDKNDLSGSFPRCLFPSFYDFLKIIYDHYRKFGK